MTHDDLTARLVDVGARFGLHSSLRCFQGLGEFHLFEPDPDEAKRLARLYADRASSLTVHPMALSAKPGQLMLKLRKHRALSSFYDFNAEMFNSMGYMTAEIAAEREVAVEVRTLDEFFDGRPVDILKLDTEGAEYDILKGAKEQMERHVLALRCEVTFSDVLPGRPMFGDLNHLITEHGFSLLNLDYAGQGVARSPFARGDRYGQLLTTDAVWIASEAKLNKAQGAAAARNAFVLAHFLFNNNATDVAVWLLTRILHSDAGAFMPFNNSALGNAVRRDIAALIKNLSYVPGSRYEDLINIYGNVFGDKFPPLFEYYYHFG